jgi:hypothetical protein
MGGVSTSTFKVEGHKGVWAGEVKIVPKLQAPGFCRVNGDIGSHDLSESEGLVFKMAGRGDPSKTLMAQIETGHSDFKGQFVANLTGVSAETKSIFVPFSSFRPFGIRPEAGGAPTKDVLKHVMQVGFLADGTKGKFEIELEEVLAGNGGPGPAPGPAPSTGGLTLFEFTSSSKPWSITNDPVRLPARLSTCLCVPACLRASTALILRGIQFTSARVRRPGHGRTQSFNLQGRGRSGHLRWRGRDRAFAQGPGILQFLRQDPVR